MYVLLFPAMFRPKKRVEFIIKDEEWILEELSKENKRFWQGRYNNVVIQKWKSRIKLGYQRLQSFLYQAAIIINPLSPNIHKQILQTDLYTFL